MELNKEYTTIPVVKRHENNPILKAEQVPYEASLLFNPGVAKYKDGYVMVFRNDYGEFTGDIFEGTNLGLAFSENGIDWEDSWKKRYTVGLMLLDLEDPSKIISILDKPLMTPEVDYEVRILVSSERSLVC